MIIANLKCFLWLRDTSDLILMVSFTFIMWHHLICIASVPFNSFHLEKFGWVSFADFRVQSLATNQNAEFMEGG